MMLARGLFALAMTTPFWLLPAIWVGWVGVGAAISITWGFLWLVITAWIPFV